MKRIFALGVIAVLAAVVTVNAASLFDTTKDTQVQINGQGAELDIGPTGAMIFSSGATLDMSAATKVASNGIGTAQSASGLATQEREPNTHKTVLTFTSVAVTMTDQGSNGNQGHLLIYLFPAGFIDILGVEANLTVAASGTPGLATGAAVVASLGTVAAATTDATLTSTEANIVASTSDTLTSYAGAFLARSTSNTQLDGVSSAIGTYLNFACPHAGSSGNDVLTVNGTMTITWINLGTN